MRSYIALALAGITLAASGVFVLSDSSARAVAMCKTNSASLTSEERSLVTQIASWRAANFPSAMAVESSATLDAAASQYAEYLAANPSAQGHYAEPAYSGSAFPWVPRAIDCGWPPEWGAGGEGLAVVSGSFLPNVSASAALAIMTDTNGGTQFSGLWHPSNNARCVGVGFASNEANKKVAWVALIFQYSSSLPCPQATNVQPGATSTPSPSPSPTPLAAPSANYGVSVLILSGWNLVTLPPGPIEDILDTAAGCYGAVYKFTGGGWERYSPLLPAYAQNLKMSEGQAFWIEGTANCGFIDI
jgi:hypothetical protein